MENFPFASPGISPDMLDYVTETAAHPRYENTTMYHALQSIEGITLNCEYFRTKNSNRMVTPIFDPRFGFLKEDFIQKMMEKTIALFPFFYPVSSQTAYAAFVSALEARGRNNVSNRISPYGVNLPSGMNITKEMVEYVCKYSIQVLGFERFPQ